MKQQYQNTLQLLSMGGVVMASDWTSGSGRYITKRAIPPFCEEIEASKALDVLKGKIKTKAKKLLKEHPKTVKIIAVTNLRSANKLLKEYSNDHI
ncbi:MAG: hypothetical protein OEY78_12785 [Gammaproteobacteria bacterium]|nr:hypothetical protein [Gammaproteobacteria bacterium]